MDQGTVSMRVAFVLRSVEVHPLFLGLCELKFSPFPPVNHPPCNIQTPTHWHFYQILVKLKLSWTFSVQYSSPPLNTGTPAKVKQNSCRTPIYSTVWAKNELNAPANIIRQTVGTHPNNQPREAPAKQATQPFIHQTSCTKHKHCARNHPRNFDLYLMETFVLNNTLINWF